MIRRPASCLRSDPVKPQLCQIEFVNKNIDRLNRIVLVDGRVSKHGVVRRTGLDRRTTRHRGYRASQTCRKRIEEVFGWIKAQAGLGKVKLRGRAKVEAAFTFTVAAYNLVRIPKLMTATAASSTRQLTAAAHSGPWSRAYDP